MKSVKIIVLSFSMIVSTLAFAQKKVEIILNSPDELMIGEHKLGGEFTFDAMAEMFGEASKVENHNGGEKTYFYEGHGLVFNFQGNVIKGFGINYNWDGDKHFPQTPYTGSFKIGDVDVDQKFSQDDMSKVSVIAMACPMPAMCLTEDREAPMAVMMGFKEGKITQVSFLVNH